MNARVHAAWALIAVLLSGCVTVEVGNETGRQSQYQLVDASSPAPAAARQIGRDLLISPLPGNSLDDSFALTYSRAPQQRSAYQFATWTERPSTRLAELLVQRLTASGGFSSVALSGRGVGGELQLNLLVNDFYHDASSAPGTARVDVTAELVDRVSRKLIARSHFSATSPLEDGNAPSAAQALSRATSDVLDQLVRWIEANAGRASAASR